MKLFGSEGEARQYLEKRVPPKEKEKTVDLARLQEPLFEIPDIATAGHYEFEGRDGFHVSFDVEDADREFNDCWLIYKNLFDDEHGKGLVTGDIKPIFTITNFTLTTENFSYDSNEEHPDRRIRFTWLPNLRAVGTEMNPSFVYIDKRQVYLAGKEGWFSRTLDLLGVFHEIGHIETRTPETLMQERNSVRTTISPEGVKTEPNKLMALELQRERDANAWMLRRTRKLFDDLGVSPELLADYVNHAQLRSYHEAIRRRIEAESGKE